MTERRERGPARYKPRGVLALEPRAFGELFDVEEPCNPQMQGAIAVVPIRGPLMHHESWWFDSYDAIRARVGLALRSSPSAIVLSLDTPGGLVSGAFETAVEIAAMCRAASVPLHAYVDGTAASAGYALAAVCETVTMPRTAIVGSVGVIASMVDMSEALAKDGVKVRLITSGARKADGDPTQPMTDEAIAAAQSQVDAMAAVFFEHVATHRGMSVDAVRAMQAAVYTGADAIEAGLADQIGTLEQLVASLAAGQAPMRAQKEATTMEEKITAAREALQAIIDDEAADEATKKRAQDALAAMDGEGEDKPMPATDEEASAKLAALTAINAALTAELSQLRATQPTAEELEAKRKRDHEATCAAAVDKAISEGRISRAQRSVWMGVARTSLETFASTVKAFPALTHRVTRDAASSSSPAAKSTDVATGGTDVEEEAKRLLATLGPNGTRAAARVGKAG